MIESAAKPALCDPGKSGAGLPQPDVIGGVINPQTRNMMAFFFFFSL